MPRKAQDIKTRFESHVFPEPNTGCWLFDSKIRNDEKSYGVFRIKTKNVLAHRVSYELYKGNIPKNMFILHSCDNRCCVNPDHLYTGTHKDNMEDMVSKVRQARGEKCKACKLNESKVREIRKLYDSKEYTTRELGKMFGVYSTNISLIGRRKGWAWVK